MDKTSTPQSPRVAYELTNGGYRVVTRARTHLTRACCCFRVGFWEVRYAVSVYGSPSVHHADGNHQIVKERSIRSHKRKKGTLLNPPSTSRVVQEVCPFILRLGLRPAVSVCRGTAQASFLLHDTTSNCETSRFANLKRTVPKRKTRSQEPHSWDTQFMTFGVKLLGCASRQIGRTKN
jgi:hypothetical protein